MTERLKNDDECIKELTECGYTEEHSREILVALDRAMTQEAVIHRPNS